jgi:hypothetical protein
MGIMELITFAFVFLLIFFFFFFFFFYGIYNSERPLMIRPGDLEGHLGTDNQYYVLDFGRIMPPEAPTSLIPRVGNSIFYDLLRVSFVQRVKGSLCSDAFSGWMKYDKNGSGMFFAANILVSRFFLMLFCYLVIYILM